MPSRLETDGMYDSTEAPAVGRLRLVIVDGDEFRTESLPPEGTVRLGRSPQCEIAIENTTISRVHAQIEVGDELTIEDLGSVNGTYLGDRQVVRGERIPFGIGEALTLGSVTLVVQKSTAHARPKRIWPHGYFEGRLDEECLRSDRVRTEFAVLRVVATDGEARALEDALAAVVRGIDVIGCYAPHDYEVLLTDCTRQVAGKVVERLTDQLRLRGVTVRIGLACYPSDGRTADVLIAHAGAPAVRPAKRPTEPPPLVKGGMGSLEALTRRVAASSISVLVLGETGVGKEVLAATIHRLSPRADKPFLALNCASLTETLLESELFGHERGAFTGAIAAKPGLLETAHTGTVFLDEVGDLPPSIQVKLLRVLEDRLVLRVGALKPKSIDVRFIAATNRDLEADVERNVFRRDLYFRLNGITLEVPPLRERRDEIESLAHEFVAETAASMGVAAVPAIDPAARALLFEYSWPGNIRELRNVMERAVVLSGGGPIAVEHLPVEKMRATLPEPRWLDEATINLAPRSAPAPRRPAPPVGPGPVDATKPVPRVSRPDGPPQRETVDLRDQIQALERQRIVEAMERCGGNQKKAAALLGISRGTLVSRLDAYGIPRPRKSR